MWFADKFSRFFGVKSDKKVSTKGISNKKLIYTFDYDPIKNRFSVLFFHGTSSILLNDILSKGIMGPKLGNVIDEVLSTNLVLLQRKAEFAKQLRSACLGPYAREIEGATFASWLGTAWALDEIENHFKDVVKHGGEVYSVTWTKISNMLCTENIELPCRFPDAEVSVVFFKCFFHIGMEEEEEPKSQHNKILEFLDPLDEDCLEAFAPALEVRFLSPLPPSRIVWHGSIEAAQSAFELKLLSPAILEFLRRGN